MTDNACTGLVKRRHHLGQIYDEVVRRNFAERAYRGDSDLDIDAEVRKPNPDWLTAAQAAFDDAEEKQKAESRKGAQKGALLHLVTSFFLVRFYDVCQARRRRKRAPRPTTKLC